MKYFLIVLIIIVVIIIFAAAFFFVRNFILNMIDKRIGRFQSELIENQIRETQNMYNQVRGWRHDYRNHIQNMKILLSEGNYDKLNGYLNELAEDLNTVDTVIKTGNVMADAVLNSKLTTAQKANIKVTVKAGVPDDIVMSDVELCAVMGNLLDNALEACMKLPEEERFLRIFIV